jgi:uncharacterized LabA/DUF88 family protein
VEDPKSNRAIVFVDANNWYHGLKRAKVRDSGALDYRKICKKLLGSRSWEALRWYVGQIQQDPSSKSQRLYAEQRKFLAQLNKQDRRISLHMGRLEKRTVDNDAGIELLKYLATVKQQLPHDMYWALHDIAHRHQTKVFHIEKAVDVMLAVDMVAMAIHDKFDTAYVLSADGDYTHAVKLVKEQGKTVIPVSAMNGHELKKACDGVMVRVDQEWLQNCYLE